MNRLFICFLIFFSMPFCFSQIEQNNSYTIQEPFGVLPIETFIFRLDESVAYDKNIVSNLSKAAEAVKKVHGFTKNLTIYIKYIPQTNKHVHGKTIQIDSNTFLIILHSNELDLLAHELSHANLYNGKNYTPIIDEGISMLCGYVADPNYKKNVIDFSNNESLAHNDGQLFNGNYLIVAAQYHALSLAFQELYQLNPKCIQEFCSEHQKTLDLNWKKILTTFEKKAPKWKIDKHPVLKTYSKPTLFYLVYKKNEKSELCMFYRDGSSSLGKTTVGFFLNPGHVITIVEPDGFYYVLGDKETFSLNKKRD